MRRGNAELYTVLGFVLSSVWLTLGCGGGGTSDARKPAASSATTPSQPQPQDSAFAASEDTLARASDAGAVPSDARPSVSSVEPTPVPLEVANPTARPGGTEPEKRDKPAAAAEPATAKEAVQVIDLRKFPKLNETRAMDGSPTGLWYMSRASVASAAAYHRTELTAMGWQEIPKQAEVPASPEYADALLAKDGFFLRLSIGATGDEGIVSVDLTNNGNVDAWRLPKFADAQEIPVDPTNANYRTPADMPTIVAFCRKELAALGWQEYAGFNPDPTQVPHHKMLRFKKNAVRLDVSVSNVSDSPLPQFPNAKTHVAYMLTGMLGYDLPVRADASDLKLDTYPWRMQFDSPAAMQEVVEFYRSAYPKLGWKELEDESKVREKSASLVFGGPDDVHFLLNIGQSEEDKEKTVVAFTQVSVKKDRPSDQPAKTVADSKPARPATEPEPPAAQAEAKPKKAAGKETLGDTLAVPDGAKGVSRGAELGMLMFNSTDDAKKIAEFYRKNLASLGWREVKLASVVQNEFASLTFEKGEDTLTVAVLDGKPESRTRTIIQGEALWPATEPDPDSPPAKPAKPRGSDEPRTAKAKPKKEHQKLPNQGTIWVGKKTYKLENVVAYNTKHAGDDVTAIVLTEKPVSPNKLKASLKKRPPDDDFVGFQPHVKLIIDESDQLIYFFLYADGVSINRGGTPDPKEMTAEATSADGQASGKVAMTKPGEFFDTTYRFEATFYTQIQNAAASATTEAEPAAGELVAEDYDGLPIPDNNTNRSSQGSKYRKTIETAVPAELKAAIEFYRRELTTRDWKEDTKAAKIEPEQATLSFAGPEGGLTVQLERKGKEVAINLVVRYTAKAKADGLLPEPNRARLILGNVSDKEAVIGINKKEYKVAAGVGAKDPKEGVSLDLAPGKVTVTIKQRGKADQTKELDFGPAEAWGVIVLPDGGCYADQLY